MNTEEKPKSGSKLEFDSNYDLRLLSNLSPALRWVLVLPIAFLAVFMVHLAYNFTVKLALSNFDEYGVISIIVNSVFILIKYSIFVVTAVGTAPVKREREVLSVNNIRSNSILYVCRYYSTFIIILSYRQYGNGYCYRHCPNNRFFFGRFVR